MILKYGNYAHGFAEAALTIKKSVDRDDTGQIGRTEIWEINGTDGDDMTTMGLSSIGDTIQIIQKQTAITHTDRTTPAQWIWSG